MTQEEQGDVSMIKNVTHLDVEITPPSYLKLPEAYQSNHEVYTPVGSYPPPDIYPSHGCYNPRGFSDSSTNKGQMQNHANSSSVNGGHMGDLYDECTLMRIDPMVQNYYTQVPNSSSTTQDGDLTVLPRVITTLMHHAMVRGGKFDDTTTEDAFGFQDSMVTTTNRTQEYSAHDVIGEEEKMDEYEEDHELGWFGQWRGQFQIQTEEVQGKQNESEHSKEQNDSAIHEGKDDAIVINGDELLTEEDIDIFLEQELSTAAAGAQTSAQDSVTSVRGAESEIEAKYIPYVNMKFDSEEDAHHFYYFYAYMAGFSVVVADIRHTISKKRNNERIGITLKCRKYFKPAQENKKAIADHANIEPVMFERQRNVTKNTGCPAQMVLKLREGKWIVKTLVFEHNHEMSKSNETRFFRSHKYMSNEEKMLIRTLNSCNISTRKMMSILSFLRGGLTALPFTKKDVSNLRTSIKREASTNDMMQVLKFFEKKQGEDPGFSYSFDLAEDGKVRSMFWSDTKCMEYYRNYGDCVSFDTTYMTNRYNLPFAPFIIITDYSIAAIENNKKKQLDVINRKIDRCNVTPNMENK
ncbi:protein FAR1-RELATED SEQUENCE 8-like [Oryza brachyantha]|uniref:protein FAR1-RELATED SEQUENCE 8-like n=1 Tax=Oryza brachyantha TaxID=4533 RepID=UPI0007763458|nr:protein FAR1-RELATED SEQUENCE 8-like [Oryza brachyantha]